MENTNKTYKFVSKHSNYTAVLRPGIEGNKVVGTQPVPQISIRFKDGQAEIKKPIGGVTPDELYEMAKAHSGFGSTFLDATEDNKDPYASSRGDAEAQHEITEMKYGTPVNTIKSKNNAPMGDEQKKLFKSMFVDMVNELPVETLQNLLDKKQGDQKPKTTKDEGDTKDEGKTETKTKATQGRPKKNDGDTKKD